MISCLSLALLVGYGVDPEKTVKVSENSHQTVYCACFEVFDWLLSLTF